MITLIENYAGLRKGDAFRLLETGCDWVRILVDGRPLYVPSNLCK